MPKRIRIPYFVPHNIVFDNIYLKPSIIFCTNVAQSVARVRPPEPRAMHNTNTVRASVLRELAFIQWPNPGKGISCFSLGIQILSTVNNLENNTERVADSLVYERFHTPREF